jgi:hypothetical protein
MLHQTPLGSWPRERVATRRRTQHVDCLNRERRTALAVGSVTRTSCRAEVARETAAGRAGQGIAGAAGAPASAEQVIA